MQAHANFFSFYINDKEEFKLPLVKIIEKKTTQPKPTFSFVYLSVAYSYNNMNHKVGWLCFNGYFCSLLSFDIQA